MREKKEKRRKKKERKEGRKEGRKKRREGSGVGVGGADSSNFRRPNDHQCDILTGRMFYDDPLFPPTGMAACGAVYLSFFHPQDTCGSLRCYPLDLSQCTRLSASKTNGSHLWGLVTSSKADVISDNGGIPCSEEGVKNILKPNHGLTDSLVLLTA